VGREVLRLLQRRSFPINTLRVLATKARNETIDGRTYEVEAVTPDAFEGMDFAFFAAGKDASQLLGKEAAKKGCIVIDKGDHFRMHQNVPLVIPEINAKELTNHKNYIASPNCSTIVTLIALAPLHRVAGLRRFVVSTYQAVSGTGDAAIDELKQQIKDYAAERPIKNKIYKHQIALNLIPQIGSFASNEPGWTSEEIKMRDETHKIFGDKHKSIRVSATCVRVPVVNGHSAAIMAEFEDRITAEDARKILAKAPGIKVVDDIQKAMFPTPLDCSGKEEVLVGRIRDDASAENGLSLFVSGDNVWKGAALNAIQIAEYLIEHGMDKAKNAEAVEMAFA
jgi:aspartate-semialdehyde dehydrogenase